MVKKSPSTPRDSPSNPCVFKEVEPGSGVAAGLASDPRWLLVQRVAQGETFRHSPRLRGFLLFISERSLRDGAAELSEYEIGTHAFERSADFNPATDSIVRSSARLLRAKLKEYFDGEGRQEPLVIEVPKGGYVPEFVARPAVTGASAEAVVPRAPAPRVVYALAIACFLLLAACVALWWLRAVPAVHKTDPAPQNLIFSIFPPGVELNLVYGDSAPVVAADNRSLNGSPGPDSAGSSAMAGVDSPGNRLITGYRDAAFGLRLAEAAARQGRTLIAHHSRLMQARDFRAGNFILLGGVLSNRWARLFEAQMNFRFDADPKHHGIRNLSPRAGESPFYWFSQEESRNAVRYAVVAMTPNLTGTGKVLMLAGQSAEGTEGAGDAALARDFPAQVLALLGNRPLHDIAGLELLLEVHSTDGAARGTKILAYRVR